MENEYNKMTEKEWKESINHHTKQIDRAIGEERKKARITYRIDEMIDFVQTGSQGKENDRWQLAIKNATRKAIKTYIEQVFAPKESVELRFIEDVLRQHKKQSPSCW